MRLEIQSASNFLVHLVRLARVNVSEKQLAAFNDALIDVLRLRYRDHWFPERPFKGSGFRCIRINGRMDSLIGQAGESVGLTPKFLHQIFPSELTLWIDPSEVSYRIGENGSICVLYEAKDGVTEPWRPSSTSSSSSSRASPPSSNQNNNNKNNSKSLKGSNNATTSKGSSSILSLKTSTTTVGMKAPNGTTNGCKDQRTSLSIEQLAAYVSS